jgi:hypothetical protein
MRRITPLITLACVVVLAGIFLVANAVGKKAAPNASGRTTPTASASATTSVSTSGSASASATPTATAASVSALFAGRSSGNQVAVAIAINGRKVAADLTPAGRNTIVVQGTADGDKVTLTGAGGVSLDGSIQGTAMFGTVTVNGGKSVFPFSAEQTVVQAVYAGRTADNQLGIAIMTKGTKVIAYVCNGHTVEAWVQGGVKGNQITLKGPKGTGLTAFMSGLNVFGTVVPVPGQSIPFSAALSSRPAGVYQARIKVNGLATRIGWAVLPDGTQLGVAVAGTTKTSAPPLDLSNNRFTLDGTTFTAAPVTGDETVVIP